MRKTKSEAHWNKLTTKQRETLDQWLFDEGLSYAAILPRAQTELGFKGSRGSLQRYYKRRDAERTLTMFGDAQDQVATVNDAPSSEAELRLASMKLLAGFLFQQVRQHPENVKEWGLVAKLIMQNNFTEMLREAKGREHNLRERAIAFAEKKFQFDMAKRALEALPETLELVEAKKDPALTDYEENIRLNRMIRAMFGHCDEVHPESEQEAKEMLAAKRDREAREAAAREAAAERQRISDELGGAQPPTPSSQYYEEYMRAKAEQKEEDERERREREKARQESLEKAKESDRESGQGTNTPPQRKPSKQYQEYLDKLKQWEEKREILGWEKMPRPEWSGRWPMMEEDE